MDIKEELIRRYSYLYENKELILAMCINKCFRVSKTKEYAFKENANFYSMENIILCKKKTY